MNLNGRTTCPIDLARYAENRDRFPPDELVRYAGEHVAFSGDGTRIVAHGPSEEALEEMLRSAGIDGASVVVERVPPRDEDTWL